MAFNEVGKIVIVDGSVFATYNTGDVITAYYNDALDRVEHYLNELPTDVGASRLTSGDAMYAEYQIQGKITVSTTGYQFCDGNNLIIFIRFGINIPAYYAGFPYFRKGQIEDSPICTVTACDIRPNGSPTITNSTLGSNDGAAKVSFFSTAAVRFSLSPNQEYASMSPPNTALNNIYTYTFNNLFPGDYTVYGATITGCRSQIQMTVDQDYFNNYSTRYFFDFDNYYIQNTIRCSIKQFDYSGSASELSHSGDDPVSLSWSNTENQDKLNNIMGGSCRITLVSQTDQEWVSVFRNVNEKEFLIELSISDTVIWRGFTIPYIYNEPYAHVPYIIEITATDGLGDLSDSFYTVKKWDEDERYEDNSKLEGNSSILDIVLFCLRKTGVIQNIRVAMNTYAASHNSTSADDPLSQTFLNNDSFYDEEEIPESCFNILVGILSSLPEPCMLFSANGYWYITPIESISSSLAYREFTIFGVYVSNGTIEPLVDFKQVSETTRAVYSGGDLRFDNIYNKISSVENRILSPNLIPDFNDTNINSSNKLYNGWSLILNGSTSIWSIDDDQYKVIWGYQNTANSSVKYVLTDQSWDENSRITLRIPYKIITYRTGWNGGKYYQLEWKLKAGTNYLVSTPIVINRANVGETSWSETEASNVYFADQYDEDAFFEIDVSFVDRDSGNIELTIYEINPLKNNFSSDFPVPPGEEGSATQLSNLNIDLPELPIGYKAQTLVTQTRNVGTYNEYLRTLRYWSLQLSNDSVDARTLAVTTTTRDSDQYRWIYEGALAIRYTDFRKSGFTTYIGRPTIDVYNGIEETKEAKTNSYTTATQNSKRLNYDLRHFDLDLTIPNATNKVRNYWKYENQTPIQGWPTRTSQSLVLDFLGRLYKEPTRIIEINGNSDVYLWPYNSMRFPNDDNRIYKWNRLNLSLKYMKFNGELAEIASDTPILLDAFDDGFSDGFS